MFFAVGIYYNIFTDDVNTIGNHMSIVRYTNKKTGRVSIYESTSCYDPIKKTSRPKRKYIGYEDPITKEFIPSSGKPGRKKKINSDVSGSLTVEPYREQYERAMSELNKQRSENMKLKSEKEQLLKQLTEAQKAAGDLAAMIYKITSQYSD